MHTLIGTTALTSLSQYHRLNPSSCDSYYDLHGGSTRIIVYTDIHEVYYILEGVSTFWKYISEPLGFVQSCPKYFQKYISVIFSTFQISAILT